ncbi:hypothetical protein Hamer_G019552 [Homarus americanus]|uniref:Uncharacterized protein n=1 Tax=Homarus americanus TaxID=6706 RepID=A0A8J5JCY2_HOMAM|nr:hypothetical protein Hamer_G019552 [Homarus americanus]
MTRTRPILVLRHCYWCTAGQRAGLECSGGRCGRGMTFFTMMRAWASSRTMMGGVMVGVLVLLLFIKLLVGK